MSNSRNFSTLASNASSGGTISTNNFVGHIASTASANTIYLQGVTSQQNNTISAVNSFVQSAYNSANNVGPQVQPAFEKANSAYSIGSAASSNTIYLQGALDQTNANVVLANTNLKSYSDNTFLPFSGGTVSGNLAITGTVSCLSNGALIVPVGTTSERPANPQLGYLRYNSTTGYFETYTVSGWGAIATPPSVVSVSPTSYTGDQGTQFTISGSFFDALATVKFITNQGQEFSAGSVSFVNSSQLLATTPQDFTVANEPLSIKVVSGSGLSYTLSSAIDCGGIPSWNTAAGTLGTYYYPANTGTFSVNVLATDPDANDTITYSVTSGSLPNGATLNSSNGQIYGFTSNGGSSVVTSNFDITATDKGGNSTVRSFNIIRKWQDGSSVSQAASSATALKSAVGSPSNGAYYYTLPSGIIQLYTDFTNFSNYPMVLVSRIYANENAVYNTGALNVSDLTAASTTPPSRTSKINDTDMNQIMQLNTIRWVISGSKGTFYRMNDVTWNSNFGTAQACPAQSFYNKCATPSNTPTWLDFSGYAGGCGGGQYNNEWMTLSGIHTSDTILGAYMGASALSSNSPAQYYMSGYTNGSWNCPGYVFLSW